MRISDWSSDVCSSDLDRPRRAEIPAGVSGRYGRDSAGSPAVGRQLSQLHHAVHHGIRDRLPAADLPDADRTVGAGDARATGVGSALYDRGGLRDRRSEEHTSELQSLMRISYAVFCLNKKKRTNITTYTVNY